MHTTAISTNSKRRKNDDYPTPGALTYHFVNKLYPPISKCSRIIEPAAGAGQISNMLEEFGYCVATNDINPDYNTRYHMDATQFISWAHFNSRGIDWVITNPPFNQAMPILKHAWRFCRVGCAFLLRLSFLEPTPDKGERNRYPPRAAWLKAHKSRMSNLMVFGGPRPSFTGDGNTDSVTTAWMVWQKGHTGGCKVDFITGWKRRNNENRPK